MSKPTNINKSTVSYIFFYKSMSKTERTMRLRHLMDLNGHLIFDFKSSSHPFSFHFTQSLFQSLGKRPRRRTPDCASNSARSSAGFSSKAVSQASKLKAKMTEMVQSDENGNGFVGTSRPQIWPLILHLLISFATTSLIGWCFFKKKCQQNSDESSVEFVHRAFVATSASWSGKARSSMPACAEDSSLVLESSGRFRQPPVPFWYSKKKELSRTWVAWRLWISMNPHSLDPCEQTSRINENLLSFNSLRKENFKPSDDVASSESTGGAKISQDRSRTTWVS